MDDVCSSRITESLAIEYALTLRDTRVQKKMPTKEMIHRLRLLQQRGFSGSLQRQGQLTAGYLVKA